MREKQKKKINKNYYQHIFWNINKHAQHTLHTNACLISGYTGCYGYFHSLGWDNTGFWVVVYSIIFI